MGIVLVVHRRLVEIIAGDIEMNFFFFLLLQKTNNFHARAICV